MRFNTDTALFDAFPSARDHVRSAPSGTPPLTLLDTLQASGKFNEALSFCAYLLPRREAVGWACGCLRGEPRDSGIARDPSADRALQAAEAWVAAPSEERRRTAYFGWSEADSGQPAAWLALGAAWSGGSVTPDHAASIPAAPHLTASVVRVGMILLLHAIREDRKTAAARLWISEGARLAEAGP